MTKLSAAIIIGVIAGIIDVLPMIAQKLNWYANISAFVFWVIMSIIISYSSIGFRGWFKGLVIAELSVIPIEILVMQNELAAVIPILFMTALLGSLVGIFSEKYAHKWRSL